MVCGYTLGQSSSIDPYVVVRTICFLIITIVVTLLLRRLASKLSNMKRAVVLPTARPFVYPTHPVIEGSAGLQQLPISRPIDAVRTLMGPAPRAFPAGMHSYLTLQAPAWLGANPKDEQWLNIRNQERIRRDGQVVWATVVQANNNLFKRNSAECGASVIYSPDAWFDRNREVLGQIVDRCFALKGTDPADPESAAFARMLTNELTRGMRMRVPSVFTGGRKVYHSSMLMPRKHLPKGILSGQYFPVWIDSQNTGAVIMVPAAYWPASLTMEWDQK